MRFPIALQPYTIREELKQDFLGSYTKVAEIGYQAVEAGPPPEGVTIEEMKAHFDRIGLQVVGCHTGLDQLTNGLDQLVDYLNLFGARYVAMSYRFDSREAVLEAAKTFNSVGAACRERGIQFLYHNHDWEFQQFDGESALDILLGATDPQLVKLELDVYWAQKGGVDPVAYLRKLKGRCPLLHVKDMEPGDERFFAEVGEGVLDFEAILAVAEEIGTEWLVVEQDACRRSPFESIAISYNNLSKMGVVAK
ncbi:sugar phosphate isomerase/epimerase [Paenibacillus rhizovicinus]|uniref:Sugar phosphate isomerase/epimerase n=1 Tax=Paenibacillus rhizovicinus TaxID=2704463 RepID=A0A6C0P458_9BACL|nr:sugar phosphate isomerase/epimerase [Paenibacillus rhizovicinus]QHW33046.1 sugar phosphate isomerase/epimerase [Paenibacillus rhizovicinus]